ncbi:hypothetical protein GCM10020227_19820 [Streptomyces flavovirens]
MGFAYGEGAAQVVELVGELAEQCGGQGGVVECGGAGGEVVGVDGVGGEGVASGGFGDGGAAAAASAVASG